MGKQVSFFMDRSDESRFLDFARSTGDVCILPYFSSMPSFPPIDNLPDYSSEDFSPTLWLFNSSTSSKPIADFIPERNCFAIDRDKSSVVEFSRTICDGRTIRPGRLWAEFKHPDAQGDLAFKGQEFSEWYESMARWIRKNYSRHAVPGFYVGRGALELIEKRRLEVKYFQTISWIGQDACSFSTGM